MSPFDNWMPKLLHVQPAEGWGDPIVRVLEVPRRGHIKLAAPVHPLIAEFLKGYRRDADSLPLLVTPMGAGESWGSNVNGDYFTREGLTHEGRDYGYKTFQDALIYAHHNNKNPEIAYGRIPMTAWNPRMDRVEAIVILSRGRARRFGPDRIIEDLEEGRPRDLSMGCKVPFDVCSICGQRSKTMEKYCSDLKLHMNQIYPDGRRAMAINTMPRFFDLSFVLVKAAKESGVLQKVAQANPIFLSSAWMAKTAGLKEATEKTSDIQKEVPLRPTEQPAISATAEPAASDKMVMELAGHDSETALSTLSHLGVVLSPDEFKRLVVARKPELAAHKNSKIPVLDRGETPAPPDPQRFNETLARKLVSILPARSGLQPYLSRRSEAKKVAAAAGSAVPVSGSFQDKLAAAYSAYRKGLAVLPLTLDKVAEAHPAFFAEGFVWSEKVAGSPVSEVSSVEYLLGAHQDDAAPLSKVGHLPTDLSDMTRYLLGSSTPLRRPTSTRETAALLGFGGRHR